MLIHNNFRSWCLQTNTDVDIIIPDAPESVDCKEYYKTHNKFKVLWLLHGTWGGYNDFVRRTNIDLYAKECGIMVVMPNAMNSDYSNWGSFMLGYNMFDFFTEELMPLIYNYFPASNKKEDNFICGVSMGAIGAVKFAVNYKDLFSGCSAMSGTPINIKERYEKNELSSRTLRRIELAGGINDFLNSYENIWDKFKDVSLQEDSPRFLFSCGKGDFLYKDYLEFKEYANRISSKTKFEEFDGYGHEWRFWEFELQRTLNFFDLKGKRNITTGDSFKKINANNL